MDFSFYLPCDWPDTSYPAQHLYREMTEEAKFAEELGYVSISVPEHHFINYLTHPSALLTTVHVAAVTKHIPIITAVLVLPFRDMRNLAGEVAQTDCPTGGRLEIGLGRGAFQYEFERFGVSMNEAKARFADARDLLLTLLTEEEVSWKSDWYDFPALTIMPRPVQRPHPPVWIAAVTYDSIKNAVLDGYHVMTTPLREPFSAVRMQARAFFDGVAEAEGQADRLRLSTLRMGYVSRNEADLREKAHLARENDRRFAAVFTQRGEVKGGAITPIEVDYSVDDVAENLIFGSPDQCVEKLKKYEELGIHNIVFNMNFGTSHKDVMNSLELMATRVIPHFA